MYQLIEKFAPAIVKTITSDHVSEYEWLLDNRDKASSYYYQARYRNFWSMNAAFPTDEFLNTYFATLESALQKPLTLTDVVNTLCPAAKRGDKEIVPFSFSTKLLHMTNTHLPVYDSRVVGFYFFREPSRTKKRGLAGQIADYVTLHDFLAQEYARVLKNGLLTNAIQEFKSRLRPRLFSDEKIIDSLIWAFVSSGCVQKKQVIYE